MACDTPVYALLNHTADLRIIVYGKDLMDLFENAATVMMRFLLDAGPADKTRAIPISVTAEDLNDLMVRWLSEILYLLMGEHQVVVRSTVNAVNPTHLEAVLHVIPYDPDKHEIETEIKAVTYHQIDVSPRESHWQAKIVFDL